MASRPTVSVHAVSGESSSSVPLPAVLTAPIRLDIVALMHKSLNKNKRQPYAVAKEAGHQTSAESWGTGRAVARIPRVAGSGTHRAGQGAFGNMCRGGRMFAPTKIWRKWHIRTGVNQRRYAVASALAASALPSLLLARGHRIEQISEVPFVIGNEAESIQKTKEAVTFLKAHNAYRDVQKAWSSRSIRPGKGKSRNRRWRSRRGPLIVYNEDKGIVKAFRNLPGVELCSVTKLNLLTLAPGGHLGRFIIWTEAAFSRLDEIFGTQEVASKQKNNYVLPYAKVTNPDISRIINSDEVQAVLRPEREFVHRSVKVKTNPLKNRKALFHLNPYAKTQLEQAQAVQAAEKKKKVKKPRAAGEKFLSTLFTP
ncbi:hypothetical protein FRC01_012278 [Tulasnella sp. 417]|nr:hypothetical protein FRC01_012278 [Tulasnella sp. 417]